MDEPETQHGDEPEPGVRRRVRMPPRRGLVHHMGQFCLGCAVVALVISIAVAAVLAAGITVPGWLRDRAERQIGAALPDHRLSFEALALGLDAAMAPQVTLTGVTLFDAGGGRLAGLGALEVSLSRRALLSGEVAASRVRLDGGRLILRRRGDGALSVAFENGDGTATAAARERPVAAQIAAILSQPALAHLRRIDADNVSLRYEDARSGRAWSADGGQVTLEREGGRITLRGNITVLGAREYASSIEVNYSGDASGTAAEFGVRFEDVPAGELAGQSPALAWLGALDAPISGALRAATDAGGQLGPLSATLQIGAGALRPNEATVPIPFRSARSYFTYDPGRQQIEFTEISVESAWGTARAEGRARLLGMERGWPDALEAQVRIGEIAANPAGLYPEPVVFEGAGADLRLDLDPFSLGIGELRLRDEGEVLRLSGHARGQAEGWSVDVSGRMETIAPGRLLELWPRTLKPKTRTWIDENVRSIDLRDIQFGLRAAPGAAPDVFLGFGFSDLSAVYVRDVPPIEAASGHASIRDNRFTIHAEAGRVTAAQGGRVDISGTDFIIPDVRIKKGPAEAHLRARGTVTAALSLLDSPPFRFLQKAGRPVTLADGRADLKGRLDFILKKKLTPEEVAFAVTGGITDMRSETLMPGRVLTAERLSVEADNDRLVIAGRARVGAVPVDGRWTMPLGPDTGGASRVRGEIELSQRFLDEFGIALPEGSLSGSGRGTVEVALARDTPAEFALTSDLAGVGLRIAPLGWALARDASGRLDVAGTLGAPPRIDTLSLEAGGLRVSGGEVRLEPGGALAEARFASVELGGWLNVPVTLVGRGKGQAPRVEVTGGTVDMRGGTLGGDGGGGGGGPVRLRLDELRISDGIALSDFEAALDTDGGARGRFTARVNGEARIEGEVIPSQAGRSAFRIRSGDAGRLLASAGILEDARDGVLELTLSPVDAPGSYDGALSIRQIRVKRAPALAALLNTISVVGLLEQFAGQGLHFSTVDARFRLTPDRLILREASAVGASAGISMDGYYNLATKRMDMQGVLSPVYMLNAIGGAFTRRGEGLIGFNFTLRGDADDPDVTVNPLSALTPGFLREMFRRPAPGASDDAPTASGQGSDDTQDGLQPSFDP
ncbi:YhdP family protein [Roseovarius ramblicola]|uniref:AsmA-like C-terminal region-containing protein n=1 Tax=Roseovarius ramblicola TaxID=2022336 RepID=A0ABV5I1T5_9RHOB